MSSKIPHPEFVTLKNPQLLGGDMGGRKYDYIILGNVFCKGSVRQKIKYEGGAESSEPANGAGSFTDLIALFSNAMKDGGRLIISNIQDDPIFYRPNGENEYAGVKLENPRRPLYNAGKWSPGTDKKNELYIFRRDYKLRPDIPYTLTEQEADDRRAEKLPHITDKVLPPPTYIEKLQEDKDQQSLHQSGMDL